jgi:hypothetical protein
MFGDEQAHGRQFGELAALDPRRPCRVERRAAAAALLGRVDDDLIGMGLRRVGRAAVTGPPADLLARALAQTSGAAHRGRVQRGWEAGVVRVFADEGAKF